MKKAFAIKNIIFVLLITAVMIVQIYPIYWIFSSSFKQLSEFQTGNPYSLPQNLDFSNYIRAFQTARLSTYFLNSLIITVCACIIIAVLASLAAFAIEKMRFKSSRFLLPFFLTGIMIPVQVTLIPMFIIYKKVGLLDTHLSLILTQVGFALPIAIYLFKEFYHYIPNDIIESVIIDGCGIGRLFRSIIVPMSKNTFITVITMNAIFIWNEYVLANTFITKSKMKTIPIGLYDYQGEFGNTDWGATFAAISITIIPLLILYFVLNKRVIAGLAAGAVKG